MNKVLLMLVLSMAIAANVAASPNLGMDIDLQSQFVTAPDGTVTVTTLASGLGQNIEVTSETGYVVDQTPDREGSGT